MSITTPSSTWKRSLPPDVAFSAGLHDFGKVIAVACRRFRAGSRRRAVAGASPSSFGGPSR